MKTRRGLVIGAGGVLGYTWSVCALHRFESVTGWDPRSADVLVGTSAGSVIATLLGSGVSASDLLASQKRKASARKASGRGGRETESALPPWPRARPLSLRLFARGLRGKIPPSVSLVGLLPEGRAEDFGLAKAVDAIVQDGQNGTWVTHPRCWVVAMDCHDGQRVAFGRAGAPQAGSRDAVRASCAVPAWFAPIRIGDRRYIDGGVVSPTSLDLLADEGLDEVVVVSPLTWSPRDRAPAGSLGEALERVMRRAMSRVLDAEVALLESRGTRVIRIEPTAHELRAMGPNFMDPRRRGLVLDAWSP